jgi:hypothetical protein
MRWVGNIARMDEMGNTSKFSLGNVNGRRQHFGDLGVHKKIILKCVLKKLYVMEWRSG